MDEPDSLESDTKDEQGYSTLGRSASRRSTPGRSFSSRSTPGRSVSGKSPSSRSTPGPSVSGRSTPGRSTPDRPTTPEPPPVPPATYHWEEVRRKRSVGGYPWTHLNKPPFDEKTWVKYERDHVYEPVTPGTSADKMSAPTKLRSIGPPKDDGHSGHFLRIPLTEELVMADETGSESEADERRQSEEEDEDEDEDDDDDENAEKKKPSSDESIYEGENENSSAGEPDAVAPTAAAGNTRMKAFQQKVKVKADVLRSKLQGVTKRKPKQKIVVDAPSGGGTEKSRRRRIGQFATLPKKFTFNAAKVNFSNTFGSFARTGPAARADHRAAADPDETKSGGRFSLPRFGFSKTSSESPSSRRSLKIGASRLSMPGFRPRTWSDASKASKPDSQKSKLMDFGTYPRIFSKRRRTDKAKTPPTDGAEPPNPGNRPRKESFRRRFFRSHKESTPGPSADDRPEQKAALAVEEELDEAQVSKESLAEFGDSDLQEVVSLGDGRRSKDTKSLSDHGPGVIEEIDSDEFFLREKGLSRGDVHISNYLSSEIRHVFRADRTRSAEGVNNVRSSSSSNRDDDGGSGAATPVRPSRTDSLRRPAVRRSNDDDAAIAIAGANQQRGAADRFSTMPKSFGGTKPSSSRGPEVAEMPENIITSRTFEPSHDGTAPPCAFRVPWRAAGKEPSTLQVSHMMPPKPPARQRVSKFSTFDTRSMIDLSRKKSQSQFGFMPTTNLSETVPKAPLRRSRTSLAGSERDISMAEGATSRPCWAVVGGGAPTPPLRRSRVSLTTDADVAEQWKTVTAQQSEKGGGGDAATAGKSGAATPPPRPPPPTSAAGYATVDKSAAASSLLQPPQSPARHRRKKSYEMIKSQEFGAFFTMPRLHRTQGAALQDEKPAANSTPPPCRPARAYNTLGPSRPRRRRVPDREHEYGDVSDDGGAKDDRRRSMGARSSSLDDGTAADGPAKAAALSSGDVIEKMKFRPLPSPPPPPRCKTKATDLGTAAEPHRGRRRNTDSALVPFLDQRETSATLSDHDFFADVSRALLASAAANAVRADAPGTDDEVSVGVQTDPLPDGYELDDLESCCSAESDGPTSRGSLLAAATAERPASRVSTATEYVDRPTSSMSTNAVQNGYTIAPDHGMRAVAGVIRAQRISVNELKVGKMTVAHIHGQRMGVDDVSGSSLKVGQLVAAAGVVMAPPPSLRESAAIQQTPPRCNDAQPRQDDDASVQSSRVSSMYPEVDSDEDRSSVLAAPTPPRRRSKPPSGSLSLQDDRAKDAADLSAAAADPSITELSCQLFRLCHSNVCSLFNKVAHQVVPEDTEKRRDLQAALCFLSIILAGLLILGFGNEKTIHHHHWDFQFPPSNQ